MTVENFYQQLAPFYHLIYPDWEASIEQLNALPGIPSATAEAIHRYFHPESK